MEFCNYAILFLEKCEKLGGPPKELHGPPMNSGPPPPVEKHWLKWYDSANVAILWGGGGDNSTTNFFIDSRKMLPLMQ